MLDKETAKRILYEIEQARQSYAYEPQKHTSNNDFIFRLCQAIVAGEAGYKDRNEWSTPIYEKVQSEMVEKHGYNRFC